MKVAPTYSVCISHYQNLKTLERSLSSILGQLNDEFEVVVVDNLSKDGSFEILSRYEKEGQIVLFSERSSRGKARQIAFERSRGRYIIAGMDLDDMFLPNLGEALDLFHRLSPGRILLARGPLGGNLQTVTIAARETFEKVGGWRDLDYYEDWDLWGRAAKLSLLIVDDKIVLVGEKELHKGRGGISAIRHQYQKYLSAWLVGYHYPVGRRPRLANWLGAAGASFAFARHQKFDFVPEPTFWEHDPKYHPTPKDFVP